MTSEGSERAERREECKEHVDDDEFRQQMRELIEEAKEQTNREEVEGGVESSDTNEEREAEAERESTEIDEGSGGDDEFRREMQELIAEVREISEKEESEDSDEFRKQMRELIDEVERELDADEMPADSAEDRLDEFEEDILENFEKYGIDGDEVRERWRERFVEDVEEELEKDPASDELDESANTSNDAADSEMTETAESHTYSESGDGTVQVLKTEGSSEATESVDESEEHEAEMEPQSEADSSVEVERNRAVEESNQKEGLESPEAEKQPENQIAHDTDSETSENSAQHELKRDLKESIPETNEDAQARQQTSETVSESSEKKAEIAEQKEAQAESTEPHSARAECEELTEEEVEVTQTEGDLNESDEEEGEVTQDSGSKSMQEWKEDGESEELADSEHLKESESTQSTLESYQEVLEENISPDAEELDEDEEVDERVASDDEGLTGMPDSPYPTVYVDETGFFAETEEQRWRRKLIELYNELPEETKQLYRELVKAMLESEEGLEKLLDTFSELREYEDFEEEHEDAIKYVKFRQKIRELELLGTQEETTVKELALELDIDQETVEKWLNDDYDSFPKIIQQVWNQEIERRWGNVLRAIANRDMPHDMSEVNEILKRFPELKRKRRFGWHYDEVKAWTEVMAAKRQGKIATLIIQGKERFKLDEVNELAKRLNLTVDKVVSWLREESRPRLVDVLTGNRRKLRLNPSEESRSKGRFHNIIDTSKEDLRTTEAQQLSRKQHLTTDERDRIIRLFDIEHPHRQTNSETDEEEELQGKDEENLKPAISKKTIKCRGAPRKVKMWIPYIRGVKISCEEDIERIIKKKFPGVQDRDDYNDILRNGKDHYKLLRAIKNYGHIKQREVEAIAAGLGVGNTKAAAWVFYGVVPAVYRWLDKAISKSEGVGTAAQLRAKLDGIETWQDVEERLNEMYPNEEYQKDRTFKTKKHHATKFLKFLKEIGKGGTVNGIASRTGLRPAAVRRFLGGHIPSAIQDVVSSSGGSRIHRTFHRVNIVLPKVREREIESIHQLREIIGRDFPRFRDRENFPNLVRDAEIHYELFLEYRDKKFIPQGVPTELQKRTGLSFDKIKGWLCDGQSPIIYRLLREALSCKEAEKKLDKLLTKLNGVTSMSVLKYRLGNVYVEYEIHQLPRYKKHQERARKFFLFLKGLRGGGLLSDVARKANLKPDEIRSWFRPDSIPNLVRMAASIPAEPPEDGKKWLPLISTNKRTFKEFIQVPTKITSPEDVLYVMKQLTTLENPRMKEYERKFDMMSKIVGLMYFLGALVSDGYFDESSHVSTYVGLSASKAYNWSRDFGRGFCYALGKIGISSKRGKDSIIEDEEGNLFTQMRWASTSTPLLLWVRRTLLGLEASAPKTWNPIKADWILDAPEDWRIAFIQGASDGDGFASIPNYCTGIATIVNQEFYLRLLKSLGIHGFFHGTHIRIIRKKSINRAKQLPMFRYAEGRQVRLTEMTVMLDSVNRKIASEKEIKTIMKLHDKGHSLGDIVVKLWNKYGISRRPSTIAGIIKRNCPKHVERSK